MVDRSYRLRTLDIDPDEYDRLMFGDDLEDEDLLPDDVGDLPSSRAHTHSGHHGSTLFANADNLSFAIPYINQTLATFGFASPLQFGSSETRDVVDIVNCIYAMLQQRQRDMEFRNNTTEIERRLTLDCQQRDTQIQRLQDKLAAKERELGSRIVKESVDADARAKQVQKLTSERDEALRQVRDISQRKVQHEHEIRKKEREFTRLQERLNSLLSEKRKALKFGKDAVVALKANGPVPSKLKHGARGGDEDFYNMIVESYEAKQKDLAVENKDLHMMVAALQTEIRDMMNEVRAAPAAPPAPDHTPAARQPEPEPALPLNAEINLQLQTLRYQLSNLTLGPVVTPGQSPAVLEAKLEEVRVLMAQQEQLLRRLAHQSATPSPSAPSTARTLPASTTEGGTSTPVAEAPALSALTVPGTHTTVSEGVGPDSPIQLSPQYSMEERAKGLDEALSKLEEEKLMFEQQRQILDNQKAAFRDTLSVWAPGAGAGIFLANALMKKPAASPGLAGDQAGEGALALSVSPPAQPPPEQLAFSFGDTFDGEAMARGKSSEKVKHININIS